MLLILLLLYTRGKRTLSPVHRRGRFSCGFAHTIFCTALTNTHGKAEIKYERSDTRKRFVVTARRALHYTSTQHAHVRTHTGGGFRTDGETEGNEENNIHIYTAYGTTAAARTKRHAPDNDRVPNDKTTRRAHARAR